MAGGITQVIDPGKLKALSSNPSTQRKKIAIYKSYNEVCENNIRVLHFLHTPPPQLVFV
jgi:hypothetical protein